MKRFITVNAKDIAEIKKVIRNVSIGITLNQAYTWVKSELQKHGIAHNDQNANHHKDLPHQGGFVSFYLDTDGKWYQAEH